jgi:hypothetical protein
MLRHHAERVAMILAKSKEAGIPPGLSKNLTTEN